MTDGLDLIFEIHSGIPRGGPGNNESTRRAFAMLPDLGEAPRILDIGCGPGMQTLELARLSAGRITGVDIFPGFLEELDRGIQAEGFAGRVEAVNASMFELPYDDGAFDVLWAEGSIFIIGFEDGLRSWKRLLRPGGCVALTELTWLKSGDPPAELCEFWAMGYSAMRNMERNIAAARDCGYEPLGCFALPAAAWWDDYYAPLGLRLEALRKKYAADPQTLSALNDTAREIELFRKYSDWYGYVFYILRSET